MSTTHLAKGSQDVPVKKGKVRLYSMRFCPYAQRVHLVLYAKNIDHDVVFINLKSKPDWYLEKFPLGKVPAIFIDGENLYESLIVADFLDEKFPKNPLYPKDPLKKAKDRIVIETFSKVITLLYKIYFYPKIDSSVLDPLFNEMDFFEKELNARGSPFFAGEKPGMVDYMIWPWFERLEMVRIMLEDEDYQIPRERFQKMWEWCKKMLEDEPVKKHYITPEQHLKYFKQYRSGSTEVDNIL